MKFVKQPTTLKVQNLDSEKDVLKERRHGTLFPNTIRMLIVGPSNCGKTNCMISMLEDINGLRFENVYIFSKSLYQPKYVELEKSIKSIKGMGFHSFTNSEDVIEPSMAAKNSIMIFDDVATEKQKSMRDYFCMGRHNFIDSFYLCQTYSNIDKRLVRDNSNSILLFKQDERNLKHVYNDHVSTDMTYPIFKEMASHCWNKRYGFLFIDKDSEMNSGRYRRGFDEFISLENNN